jgi:AcrR family transcriptional regulator
LLQVAAQHITRGGYADLKLERVAADAGYTRGAIYHLFSNKEELVVAVVDWVRQLWVDQVAHLLDQETDHPVETLTAVARAIATYSRDDVPRVLTRLRAEFAGTDHPIGGAVNMAVAGFVAAVARLITQGRSAGTIPAGLPAPVMATAYLGAMDGVVNHLGDQEPFDVILAERAALGVLGLPAPSHD